MKILYITLAISLAVGLRTSAQDRLTESVEVEGQYSREILHPEKIGNLPERQRLILPQSGLPYSTKGVQADFVPSAAPIPATSYGAHRLKAAPRGYLSLASGSWLNSDLRAGYALLDAPDQSLNILLRHSSTSLWKPFKDMGDNHARFSYQEAIGIDWSKLFNFVGRLDVSARYHAGYFNYYGVGPIPMAVASLVSEPAFAPFPTQTINDVALNFRLRGLESVSQRNRWSIGAAMRHFAFRTATRETSVILSGGYRRVLSADPANFLLPSSDIGFDASLEGLFYSIHAPELSAVRKPDNYGNFRLSPNYRWSNQKVSLRIGLNADFTFNADAAAEPAKNHYSVFHISPDVRFDYSSTRFAAWIHATGGQQLATLASIADRNLYCNPNLQSTTPLYVPIDAQIGFRLRPFSGAQIEGHLGYRIIRNLLSEGWGVPLIALDHQLSSPWLNLENKTDNGVSYHPSYGMGRARYNLSGIYVGAAAGYELGNILNVSATMEYAPQNATHGIFNAIDRPRWIVNPRLDLQPLKPLTIGVSYEYRGVRTIWSAMTPDITTESISRVGGPSVGSNPGGSGPSVGPGQPQEEDKSPAFAPQGVRLPDITRLNANASWRFDKIGKIQSLTLGIECKNILGHREVLLPGVETEGFIIQGGIEILF